MNAIHTDTISTTCCALLMSHFVLDATVVVGDVSDEESILNAAFINKKVSQYLGLVS